MNGKLHFLDNQPPCVFEKASVSLRPPSSEFMINCGGIYILSLHNDYNVSGPASSKVHLLKKFLKKLKKKKKTIFSVCGVIIFSVR